MAEDAERREARVTESGAGVFLSLAELEKLGVDPEATDAIEYGVEEGSLQIEAPLPEATP